MPISKRSEFIEGHMVLSPTTRNRMIARNDIKWDLAKDHVAKVDDQVAAQGDVTDAVKETLRLRQQAKDDATITNIKNLTENDKCAVLKKDGQPCVNIRMEGQDGCHIHTTMRIKVHLKDQKIDKNLDKTTNTKGKVQVNHNHNSIPKISIVDNGKDQAEHTEHIVAAKHAVDNQVQQKDVNIKCGKPTGSDLKGPPCKFNCLDGRDGCRHHATAVDDVHSLQIQQSPKDLNSAKSGPIADFDNVSLIACQEDNALVIDNQQDEGHYDIARQNKDTQLINPDISGDDIGLPDDSDQDTAAITISRCGMPTGQNKNRPPCEAFRLARADGCRHHFTRN